MIPEDGIFWTIPVWDDIKCHQSYRPLVFVLCPAASFISSTTHLPDFSIKRHHQFHSLFLHRGSHLGFVSPTGCFKRISVMLLFVAVPGRKLLTFNGKRPEMLSIQPSMRWHAQLSSQNVSNISWRNIGLLEWHPVLDWIKLAPAFRTCIYSGLLQCALGPCQRLGCHLPHLFGFSPRGRYSTKRNSGNVLILVYPIPLLRSWHWELSFRQIYIYLFAEMPPHYKSEKYPHNR